MNQQIAMLFYFFARDEVAAVASSTITFLLNLLHENKHGRQIVCYVGIDAIGAESSGKGELFPSGDWRMYRIRHDENAAPNSPLEIKWLSKSDSKQDLATGVKRFLALAEEDLGNPDKPRTTVLSVTSHGIPAFGLSSRQYSQVTKHIASRSEEEIKEHLAEIVKATREGGNFKGDQRQSVFVMLEKIGLANFFEPNLTDSGIEDGLGMLRLCFSFPSMFQRLGVGVMALHAGLPLPAGLAVEQATRRKSDEDETSKSEESSREGSWDSLSIRHFRAILQKHFPRNRLDLILLHNCSLGMLETFYELRDVANHVLAANTPISGALVPSKWFFGIPELLSVRQWCEHILSLETNSYYGYRSLVGVRNDDTKAWRDAISSVSVYVDNLNILRQCSAFQQLRNACSTNDPTTVSIDRLVTTVNSCVANAALQVAIHSLLLGTPPNLPSIYLPTCGLAPHDTYREPMSADDPDGFSFLEEVRWHEVLKKGIIGQVE